MKKIKNMWKGMNQRKKGAMLGFIFGTLFWLLKVDFAIGMALIPVVMVVGLVMLDYIAGLLLTAGVFAAMGYGAGWLQEKMGQRQGLFTGAVTVAAIAMVFIAFWKPGMSLLPGSSPQLTARAQTTYAMKPFETLASVAKLGYEPGNIWIAYSSQQKQIVNPCPTECTFGCLPTGTCKPVGTSEVDYVD